MQQGLSRPWWLLPPGRLNPLWWVAVTVVLIWVDYVVGAGTQFPVLYVIPVALAAWYSGRRPALAIALAVPLAHIIFVMAAWHAPGGALAGPVGATIFRGAAIVIMALWFGRLAEHEQELYRHVERLEGLLPICAFCKRIRNGTGDWEPLEQFISTRSEAQFSHAFCPECIEQNYPEFSSGPPRDGG